MLTWFTADLHVHTCLSPCADLTLSPKKIVAAAVRRGLRIIAITDHNSARNAPAVMRAAHGTPITVLPGMEVCTKEEVHVLALFGEAAPALELQCLVYQHLEGANDPDVFGLQVIANEQDEVEGFEERLLIGATALSLEEVVDAIHRLDGLAIASHIDRERNGVIGQLGFIPHLLPLDAVEITQRLTAECAQSLLGGERHLPVVRNSDAHGLERLGEVCTRYLMSAPTIPELRMALRCELGREVGMSGE